MIIILNVVSFSSTCYCVNVCIHLCAGSKLLFTASYHDLKCGFSLLNYLCVNLNIPLFSGGKLRFTACMIMILKLMWFLFPPLATVWTCAFTYAQLVSYISLLIILCIIVILNVVSLSSTCYCVNLDINWFMSASKLLFIWSAFICLISILYMIMVLNLFFFLHLLLCEHVHSLMLSG